MQAAFISYAVFLALLILLVIVVIIIIVVRSLLESIRARRTRNHSNSGGRPPASAIMRGRMLMLKWTLNDHSRH